MIINIYDQCLDCHQGPLLKKVVVMSANFAVEDAFYFCAVEGLYRVRWEGYTFLIFPTLSNFPVEKSYRIFHGGMQQG
jgi:hypothetical protein